MQVSDTPIDQTTTISFKRNRRNFSGWIRVEGTPNMGLDLSRKPSLHEANTI